MARTRSGPKSPAAEDLPAATVADSENDRGSESRGSPKERLAELRRQIGKIDRQLVALIQQRLEWVRELANTANTATDGAAVTSAVAVDSDVMQSIASDLPEASVRAILREIAAGCRAVVRPLRVAFLGPLHSYSHLAAIEYFGSNPDWAPLTCIADVFTEVVAGHVDHAVVPLENSTDGRIVDTLSTFVHIPARICAEVPLRICHCLLAGGARSEIKRVLSKPQALSQCRRWLANHLPDAELVEAASTTAAAASAAEDRSIAAVAGRQAAAEYRLGILAEHIEDNENNITRFVVLGKEPARRTGRDKTALLFQVDHQPGALADVMAVFKRNRLNLTWIESFPFRWETKQEYLFFLEFEGHAGDLRPGRALAALSKKTQRLDVLGSFPQANLPST